MANILIKLVGSGIGLAAEAREARKVSKNTTQASISRETAQGAATDDLKDQDIVRVPEDQADQLIAKGQAVPVDQDELEKDPDDPPPKYTSEEENDEADWELNDAAEEQTAATTPRANDEHNLEVSPSGEKDRQHYVDKIVVSFVGQYPPPSNAQRPSKLPCSVIVPQRRPRDKTRGFIRAYAPVLSECGIDQTTFLQFLEIMDKASKVGLLPQAFKLLTHSDMLIITRLHQ